MRHGHRLAERGLKHRAQDQPEHRGRNRPVVALHAPAERAEDYQHPAVVDAVGLRIDPGDADRDNRRIKPFVGHAQQPGEHAGERQVKDQQQHIGDEHAGDHRPDHVRIGVEEVWPRPEAIHDQGTEHNRGRTGPGDTEREHRHEAARHRPVIGRLRAGDTLDGAPAEPGRILSEPLFDNVGHECGDGRSSSRQDSDDEADH